MLGAKIFSVREKRPRMNSGKLREQSLSCLNWKPENCRIYCNYFYHFLSWCVGSPIPTVTEKNKPDSILNLPLALTFVFCLLPVFLSCWLCTFCKRMSPIAWNIQDCPFSRLWPLKLYHSYSYRNKKLQNREEHLSCWRFIETFRPDLLDTYKDKGFQHQEVCNNQPHPSPLLV